MTLAPMIQFFGCCPIGTVCPATWLRGRMSYRYAVRRFSLQAVHFMGVACQVSGWTVFDAAKGT
ncbi:MAG: hypothetical protein AAGH78_04430, partial [Cyanobacteria bacterium P01_H01_bin.58]